MPFSKSRFIVACAGAGKTTALVKLATSDLQRDVLLVTYTNENVEQIKSEVVKLCGCVPPQITIIPWFTFLLRDGVRPYQNQISSAQRVSGIYFDSVPAPANRTPKVCVDKYYLAGTKIYRDRLAEFVCDVDDRSKGLVVSRLRQMYGSIFVDEFQDLAGYDLEFIEKLCQAGITLVAVGDPRQANLSTNNSRKHCASRKGQILNWVTAIEKEGLITTDEWTTSHRANQSICDFADSLFPNMPRTESSNSAITGHDGVFTVAPELLPKYIERYQPKILRDKVTSNTLGIEATNFGLAKGRTYDRVLIFPTGPMKEFIFTGDLDLAGDVARFYVAVTRARFSVAFVWIDKRESPIAWTDT